MSGSAFTPEQRADFDRDGYVMIRALFDPEEAKLLQQAMETDPEVVSHRYNRKDAQGLATRIVS